MKKNKFLALTMLCSTLCGISTKAQEIKDSTSQKIGGVENSSNNEGNKNLEKNKNLEEKSKTRNKKGKFSRFVDLVKRHPVWSTIIGVGSVLAEEGIRRKFFPGKWGVDKFGYNEEEDCIYRNPKGRINVVILGPKEYREKFIEKLKNNEKYRKGCEENLRYNAKYPYLELTEKRAKFENWKIIQKDFDFSKEPSEEFKDKLSKDLKNDVAALIVVHNNNGLQNLAGIGASVKNIKCGDKEFSDLKGLKGLKACRMFRYDIVYL